MGQHITPWRILVGLNVGAWIGLIMLRPITVLLYCYGPPVLVVTIVMIVSYVKDRRQQKHS